MRAPLVRSTFPLALAAIAAVAATALAQTPPCIALNDVSPSSSASITAFGFAGPGINAYQFTPATALVLQAAEVYTSSSAATATPRGYQTLEIWDTGASGLPGTRLAGGTWQNQPTLPVSWQGASFDQLAILASGQPYWLVWRESGGNRLPYETGGVTMPHARFTGGQWVLQASPQPLKWRGYCSLLDDANVLPLGMGCPSSTSRVPAAFTNHAPALGNADFQFDGTGFPPGSVGLAVLGANPAWIAVPIPGAPATCLLHVDPLVTATVLVGTGNEQALHTTGAAGHVWLDLAIPGSAALAGVTIDAQFAVFDAALPDPLPFVFSNGVRITLF